MNLPQTEVPTGFSYPVDHINFDIVPISSMELLGAVDITSGNEGVSGFR